MNKELKLFNIENCITVKCKLCGKQKRKDSPICPDPECDLYKCFYLGRKFGKVELAEIHLSSSVIEYEKALEEVEDYLQTK